MKGKLISVVGFINGEIKSVYCEHCKAKQKQQALGIEYYDNHKVTFYRCKKCKKLNYYYE